MIKVNDLINLIDKEFPLTNAIEWDNHLGLIIGKKNKLINKVLICLDVTSQILEYCLKHNIYFVISYHPFLFCRTLKEEWDLYPYKKSIFEKFKKNKIGLYVIHTSYDHHPKGASFALSKLLKVNSYTLFKNNYGLLVNKQINTLDLINNLKKIFNLKYLETNFKNHFLVDKYLFLPGSGDPCLIHSSKAKLVITSDIKWSNYILAKEHKVNLISIPHYIEEYLFLKTFYNFLKKYIDVCVYKLQYKNYIY